MRTPHTLMVCLICSVFLLFPFDIFAASSSGVPDTGAIQDIENTFRNAAELWPPIIIKYTEWLFWSLVTLSWTWAFSMMALKGTDFTEILTELTRRTILTGFFWWLLKQAPKLGSSIVEGFSFIGNQLVGKPISASDIFDVGLSLGLAILQKLEFFNPAVNLGYTLIAIAIVIILALIALQMLLIVIQYVVFLNAGVIMMGFLGHEWSREYAINYFRLLLALGVKFFIMQIIVVLTMTILNNWIKASDLTWVQVMVILPILIVIYGLITEIPAMAASMISGTDSTGGAVAKTIQTAAMVGALAMSGGASAMSGAMTAGNMGSLAYNSWKEAKNLLSGGGKDNGGDNGTGGSGDDEGGGSDPATASLPNDTPASDSSDSSLSQLPRSHQESNSSNDDNNSTQKPLSAIETEKSHQASNDGNTESSNTGQTPSNNSTQKPLSAIETEKSHQASKTNSFAEKVGGTFATAKLASKLASKALAAEGKQSFINGLNAFQNPDNPSMVKRAAQSFTKKDPPT